MTKEEYENFSGNLFCTSCNVSVPKVHMDCKRVHLDGKISSCNICGWINRHGGLPKTEFSDVQIKHILHMFIYNKVTYLNDVASYLNISIENRHLFVAS